jgi:hypothetical protein
VRTALTSTAAGATVTAIGVVALIAMFGATSSTESTAAPATAAIVTETAPPPPPETTTTQAPDVVVVEVPTPDLAGVGSAVARVLYANGYVTDNDPEELAGDLPPAVLALLVERQATLTIAIEATDDENSEATP